MSSCLVSSCVCFVLSFFFFEPHPISKQNSLIYRGLCPTEYLHLFYVPFRCKLVLKFFFEFFTNCAFLKKFITKVSNETGSLFFQNKFFSDSHRVVNLRLSNLEKLKESGATRSDDAAAASMSAKIEKLQANGKIDEENFDDESDKLSTKILKTSLKFRSVLLGTDRFHRRFELNSVNIAIAVNDRNYSSKFYVDTI